jgi:hypothetical protein
VREPGQDAVLGEARELDARHSRPTRLRRGQEAPLPLSKVNNQALEFATPHTLIVSLIVAIEAYVSPVPTTINLALRHWSL